jgi:D-alanine-D-alanine ligase
MQENNLNLKTTKIAVLLGGDSQEREISLQSGQAVYNSLLNLGANVCKIDIVKNQQAMWLKQIQTVDFAFIALHGRGGEDGKIQALLELIGIPYTGSSVTASAIAMNKYLTKQIWHLHQLQTPAYQLINASTDLTEVITNIGFPMIVKPAHEGSSIGISKVMNEKELQQAYQLAAQFDKIVIAEKWITGKEYTASILNGQVLPIIRLETPRDFYDYEAKYQLDNTQYYCPCGLDESIEEEIKILAKKAFELIGASGWGRVDFMLDDQNQPWLIELNTVPGLTSHSLVPMAAKQSGMSFEQLVMAIINAEKIIESAPNE